MNSYLFFLNSDVLYCQGIQYRLMAVFSFTFEIKYCLKLEHDEIDLNATKVPIKSTSN